MNDLLSIFRDKRILGCDSISFQPYVLELETPVLKLVGTQKQEMFGKDYMITTISVFDHTLFLGMLQIAKRISDNVIMETFYPVNRAPIQFIELSKDDGNQKC